MLQLVLEMLLELPPSKRRRSVHVLSNDTLVESPVLQTFVDQVLEKVREAGIGLRLPLIVMKTTPEADHTFWVNLIGRGYPAPTRFFRWCTDRMKIRPTSHYIRTKVSEAGEAILLLGVRRDESSTRMQSVRRYDMEGRLHPHNDLKGCFVYRPIVELTTQEVWTVLLQRRPPWGGTHHQLVTLYRNAQGGECPFIVDASESAGCGTSSSRFGCWTCTVVDKDKSLQGFVDAGLEHLEPLVEFRDWLKEYSRDFSNRMEERRNGQAGIGPFRPECRRLILDRLLQVQETCGLPLISETEVSRIREVWAEDACRKVLQGAERVLKMLGA